MNWWEMNPFLESTWSTMRWQKNMIEDEASFGFASTYESQRKMMTVNAHRARPADDTMMGDFFFEIENRFMPVHG